MQLFNVAYGRDLYQELPKIINPTSDNLYNLEEILDIYNSNNELINIDRGIQGLSDNNKILRKNNNWVATSSIKLDIS